MPPVPINRLKVDEVSYISWWQRNVTSPKCRYCERSMRELERKAFPNNRLWICNYCDYVIVYEPSGKQVL